MATNGTNSAAQQAAGDDLTEQARHILSNGLKIRVLGVTPGNMGEWWKKYDCIDCWLTDDSKKRIIPGDTGLILRTRFIDGELLTRVKATMPKTAILNPGDLSTGEIKDILHAVQDILDTLDARSNVNGAAGKDATLETSKDPSRDFSDSARRIASFGAGLPQLGEAVTYLLREYSGLLERDRSASTRTAELERAQAATAVLRASNEELSGEIGVLKGDLTTANERIAELQMYEEETARLEREIESLRAQFTAEKTRADGAESELTSLKQSLNALFAATQKK